MSQIRRRIELCMREITLCFEMNLYKFTFFLTDLFIFLSKYRNTYILGCRDPRGPQTLSTSFRTMKTIPRPDQFLLGSCYDLQVRTAFSLCSPRFSRPHHHRTFENSQGNSQLKNMSENFRVGNIFNLDNILRHKYVRA
jgi:hypothetical protein